MITLFLKSFQAAFASDGRPAQDLILMTGSRLVLFRDKITQPFLPYKSRMPAPHFGRVYIFILLGCQPDGCCFPR